MAGFGYRTENQADQRDDFQHVESEFLGGSQDEDCRHADCYDSADDNLSGIPEIRN